MTRRRTAPRPATAAQGGARGAAANKARWWPVLLLVAATTVVYANSLPLPFVFDDQFAIVENESIRSLTPLSTALRAPAQSATAGRPSVNLSLALNYAVGGLAPRGYHAWNLAVHLSAGLLLFGIVRRTWAHEFERHRPVPAGASDSTLIAVACALLWVIHPLQSEVLDYVVQRTESMMGLASLATLYLAMRGMHASSPARWYVSATVACALGMTAKESMATTPLLVLLYDLTFGARQLREVLRARWGLYLGLAACWLILAVLVSSGPRSHSAGFASGISPWTYFLNQPAIIVRYLRLTVWPVDLVADYGPTRDARWQEALGPGAGLLVLMGATLFTWFRDRRLAFLGVWFFLTLAPTSSVIPIATEVGAERRMYLPLAAIVVVAVVALLRLSRNRRIVVFVGSAVALALGILTVQRNAEYADPVQLWQTVVKRYPHGRAHYNLGIALRAEGRRAEAIGEFETAAPDDPDADYALGFELAEDGRHTEAVRHLRQYTLARPDDLNVIRAYTLLGRSLLMTGSAPEAEAAFRETLRIQPRNVDALGGLGDSLLAQQRPDEAIVAYQAYVGLSQLNMKVYANLGLTLARQGRHEDAIRSFGSAIALAPGDAAVHVNLASSLAEVGRFAEAIAECRRALPLEPDATGRTEIEALIAEITAAQERASR